MSPVRNGVQTKLFMALAVGVAVALGVISTTIDGSVQGDLPCTPAKDFSSSARTSALGWLQVTLIVGLAASLLYGPVAWEQVTLFFCFVHVILCVIFVAWPPANTSGLDEALLIVTALAPGTTVFFHYAFLRKGDKSLQEKLFKISGILVVAVSAAQFTLAGLVWQAEDVPPILALVAGTVAVTSVAIAWFISKFVS